MHTMSKRKINLQQQRRIQEQRDKLLSTPEQTGLVVANFGTSLELEDNNGVIITCSKRQHLGPVVSGDKVVWQLDTVTNTGVVLKVEPRTTLLARPDARGELHAVAANIDQMLIVIAPVPPPSQTTIDRYIVVAESTGITPIIILNKEDLLQHASQQAELLEYVKQYENLGIQTILVSAKEKYHLALVEQQLQNKISVFVGQSGVGKSSIIDTFIPEQTVKAGPLSTLGQHGKHTTTTARLYHLPGKQGSIIDSPGIREFPLWEMPAAELALGFIEFKPFLGECKFRNCAHTHEPGCALLHAVSAGKISNVRFQSYQKILAGMPSKQH